MVCTVSLNSASRDLPPTRTIFETENNALPQTNICLHPRVRSGLFVVQSSFKQPGDVCKWNHPLASLPADNSAATMRKVSRMKTKITHRGWFQVAQWQAGEMMTKRPCGALSRILWMTISSVRCICFPVWCKQSSKRSVSALFGQSDSAVTIYL